MRNNVAKKEQESSLPDVGLPARLRKLRHDLGYATKREGATLEEIESLTGVKKGTLQAWESGRNEPKLGAIKAFAERMATTASFVAFGEGDPPAYWQTALRDGDAGVEELRVTMLRVAEDFPAYLAVRADVAGRKRAAPAKTRPPRKKR